MNPRARSTLFTEVLEQRRFLAFTATGTTTLLTPGLTVQQLQAARNGNGQTVAVWTGKDNITGLGDDITVARLSALGVVQQTFIANATTTDTQQHPDVAISPTGNFAVAWQSRNQDGDSWGVYVRLFGATGTPLTGETLVNTTTAGGQITPAIAMSASGSFVVTWASTDIDGDSAVFARRFSSIGVAQGGEVAVSDSSSVRQEDPDIAIDANGEFTIAWTRIDDNTGANDVLYGGFTSTGGSQFGPIDAASNTTGDQFDPSIAENADGDFAIAFVNAVGGTGAAEFRLFQATGSAVGNDITGLDITGNEDVGPRIAIDGDGNVVIGYTSVSNNSWDAVYQWFDSTGHDQTPALTVSGPGSTERAVADLVLTGNGTFNDFTMTAGDDSTNGIADTNGYLSTLDIAGTSAADNVVFTGNDVTFSVNVNGSTNQFPAGVYQRVDLTTGDGNDTVTATSLQISLNADVGIGDDLVFGSLVNDTVYCGAGDDTVWGNAGNDYLFGDVGRDQLHGEDGADTLTGAGDRNTLWGGPGDDRLNGSGSRDLMYGDEDSDRLYGGGGDDTMYGGGGVDRFFGGDGNDIAYGQGSNDKMYMQDGDDTMFGGKGIDIFDGGNGTDTAADDDSSDILVNVEVF